MHHAQRVLIVAAVLVLLPAVTSAQVLPDSGVRGHDLVWATSPTGTSQLFAASSASLLALPLTPTLDNVPSRWAHRRRTLGALETKITTDFTSLVAFTPLGDAAGNGAIHVFDLRLGLPPVSSVIPTGNPAGYDLAVFEPLKLLFSIEDDGFGSTLRGYSYATPGQFTPISPPTLALPGRPAAYVNRIGIDVAAQTLHVPTATGVQIVQLSSTVPHMSASAFVSTTPAAPATNPTSFVQLGTRVWVMGITTFASGTGKPDAGGFVSWTDNGSASMDVFGPIPNLSPTRNYVPAVGAHELAVVGDGTNTWVYYPQRDPSATAFYIRPSAIGVARFLGSNLPVAATIPCPDDMGEPFANPSVSGTRVAIESSLGPPFYFDPPNGAEKVSVLYSPLDPLGAATLDGLLGVPGPLGGRISTKGMERPMWSRDGSRVLAFTSHFPGAPHPGVPGIEVLDVPPDVPVDSYVSPHTVVENPTSPNQSIVYPGAFVPRASTGWAFLDSSEVSIIGNVFHDGMASVACLEFGEIGQKQIASPLFVQSSDVPGFPALLRPSFEDATGSTVPIPGSFGARRTAMNLLPALGFRGVTTTFADGDVLRMQPTGGNTFAALGIGIPFDPIPLALPSGWITTTELASY